MSMSAPKVPKPIKPPPPPPSISDPQVMNAGTFLRFNLRPAGLYGATRRLGGQQIQRGKAAPAATAPAALRGS